MMATESGVKEESVIPERSQDDADVIREKTSEKRVTQGTTGASVPFSWTEKMEAVLSEKTSKKRVTAVTARGGETSAKEKVQVRISSGRKLRESGRWSWLTPK